MDTLGPGPWDLGAGRGRIHVEVVTRGVDRPWGIAFLPEGGFLLTERPGRLRVFKNGKLDEDALARFVDWQITEGIHGLVPTGTTGESPTLDYDEHKRVIEITIETMTSTRVKADLP